MRQGVNPDPGSILARLMSLHPKRIDLSLDRVQRLLADLGNPEQRLPPVIHVAGTNGKGSVIAYLRAFLEEAGYRVHVYTSPHLVHFNERIRVAGQVIQDGTLATLLEEVEAANAGRPITFFEITTAAAFLAFSRWPADVVLLETGLGGRLDATNVVRQPALTILTPISMDHEEFLGGRIEAIAAEKSHILKPAVGCVTAKQERKVAGIIELRSLEVGAPVWREGAEWFIRTHQEDQMVFEGVKGRLTLPLPALHGNHQVRNAGLAIAALERLTRLPVPGKAVAAGLKSVEWPARMQRLTRGPLVALLPPGWELWLDGAHNPAAGEMLSKVARTWRDKPVHMVLGMLRTKDLKGFVTPLVARLDRLRTIAIPGQEASLSAEEALAVVLAQGCHGARAMESLSAAVTDILETSGGVPGRILITGSLYLAGTVLAENG
ncbi:MAG: bifunctional folylpolyglutamate synthase/dihydrofolate synthase [Alphaproteobacteria bacterium]